MKKRFLAIVLILTTNIFLCSCSDNQENISDIPDEPIVVLREEDKELSRSTVENFMNEICEFDVVAANQYVVNEQSVVVDSPIDINELKQDMLNSIKETPLDDYRMYDLVDKIFNKCSFEILNSYEEGGKYIYDVWVEMPDMNRMSQEIPNTLNDDVLEEVIADCLYKGVLTEADLYRENLPASKQQAFMSVAVDKVIEILNEKVDSYVSNAKVKLILTKQNGTWLIDRDLSDMDDFFAMFD
ncbi:MAG: hypothetical protein IJW15_01035 [Clostridia bacterium]|nr:hypothetical protein [Clostridia bacterium]